MKKLTLFFFLCMILTFPSSILSNSDSLEYAVSGKKALDSLNYQEAIKYFTRALDELDEIGDYILYWRAKAYREMEKFNEALRDLETLKLKYPLSPLTKDVKKLEISIRKSINDSSLSAIYQSYLNEYSEDLEIKYDYALYLKENGYKDRAKRLFREIFVTSSSFADKVEIELSDEDITVEDLINKGRALNSVYLFKKSEKYLREALRKAKNKSNEEILSVLGYNLFMQKRYEESALIFKKIRDYYWRGRALLRAKDFITFEKELPLYLKSGDQRIGEILINYANIKRRAGNTEGAIEILRTAMKKYPNCMEEAMWNLGWNLYITGNHEEAGEIFKELYNKYGSFKYLYWYEKTLENRGLTKSNEKPVEFRQGDFYSYLLYMKGRIANLSEVSKQTDNMEIPNRLRLLIKANFRDEALREIKHLIRNNRDSSKIPFYSMLINKMGDYATSIRLISKLPDRTKYHELLYPKVYSDTITKYTKNLNLDPFLIYAVMREESRFDRAALSPAGAIGLMQLMPNTAKIEGKKIGIPVRDDREIFEPEKNIAIGSHYLSKLLNEFNNVVLAIAAYNAGEKAVTSWLNENRYHQMDDFIEDIPYNETRNYVKRVLASYFEYLRATKNLSVEKISEIIKIRGGRQ